MDVSRHCDFDKWLIGHSDVSDHSHRIQRIGNRYLGLAASRIRWHGGSDGEVEAFEHW